VQASFKDFFASPKKDFSATSIKLLKPPCYHARVAHGPFDRKLIDRIVGYPVDKLIRLRDIFASEKKSLKAVTAGDK
jgi:hypothetical protein